MAKIPDATGLIQGGAPRSNRGGIVSFNSGAGEGLMQAGKAMGQVGAEIEQKINDDDKVAAARAMLRFQQEEAALEEEIRQDPSQYETIRSRYAERYGKAFNESVGALQNPRNKELFTLAAKEVYTKTDSRLAGVRDKYYSEHLDADYLSNLEAAKNRVRPDMSPEDLQAQLLPFNVLADNAGKVQGVDAAMRKKLQAKAELDKAWLDKKTPQEVFEITNAQIKNQPLNVRNNNPGNLRGADGQFRKFATAEEGLAAMKADLTAKVSGSSGAMKRNFGEGYKPSLRNIINTYAPKSENDTDAYIASVAKDTGLDPDAPLSAADVEKIMPAMIKVEGGSQSMAYYQGYKLDADVAMAKYNESKSIMAVDVRRDIQAMAAAEEMNVRMPQDKIDSAIITAKELGLANEYETLLDMRDRQAAVADFVPLPITDMDNRIREMQVAVQGGDLSKVQILSAYRDVRAKKAVALNKDPRSYYEAQGLIQQPAVGIFEGGAGEAQRRRTELEPIEKAEKIKIPLVTTQEVSSIVADYSAGKNVADKIAMLGSVLTPSEIADVANMIPKDAGGDIVAAAMTVDSPQTASRILDGNKMKGFVTLDEFRDEVSAKIGGLYDRAIEDKMYNAIYAVYKTRANDSNNTSDSIDSDLLDDAIKLVAGDVAEISFGGTVSRIPIPEGKTEYDVRRKFDSLTDADFNLTSGGGVGGGIRDIFGNRASAQNIMRSNRFVALGSDKYALYNGSTGEPLIDSAGNKVIIDLNNISPRYSPFKRGGFAVINAEQVAKDKNRGQ